MLYGALGEVEVGAAALGRHSGSKPGAVAGTALQQRLATRTLTLLFAVLLTAIGVRLLIA